MAAANEWIGPGGEPYEGPPPPNNNNYIPEPPPHIAVEAGSIQPLSEFTKQLHIREAFFEAFPHHEEDGNWHFIEFDLTAAQCRYAFSRDRAHGGEMFPHEDFVDCLNDKDIEELEETYDGEYVDEDRYVDLPDPIPFQWLRRMDEGDGALRLHIFRKSIDQTPSGYNAEHNTNWYGDDIFWYFYVMFVQDSATTAKMYIAWDEEGEHGIPEEAIGYYFNDLWADLQFCLRPALKIQNMQRIAQRAEELREERRAKQALALSGRRETNNRQLPATTVAQVMSYVPRARRRTVRRRNRRARRTRRRV